VALPATATPIHACIATIGLTGTTGIGVTRTYLKIAGCCRSDINAE
jgi:hypothetical protein